MVIRAVRDDMGGVSNRYKVVNAITHKRVKYLAGATIYLDDTDAVRYGRSIVKVMSSVAQPQPTVTVKPVVTVKPQAQVSNEQVTADKRGFRKGPRMSVNVEAEQQKEVVNENSGGGNVGDTDSVGSDNPRSQETVSQTVSGHGV